jgi:hypothetical protein
MSVGDFNAAIKAFQFRDAVGHVWEPGATTDGSDARFNGCRRRRANK